MRSNTNADENPKVDVVLGRAMLELMHLAGVTPSVVNGRLVVDGARPDQQDGVRQILEQERHILAALATPKWPRAGSQVARKLLEQAQAVGMEVRLVRNRIVMFSSTRQDDLADEIRRHELAVVAILTGEARYPFTPVELRRLDFVKWRFANRSPEDARAR